MRGCLLLLLLLLLMLDERRSVFGLRVEEGVAWLSVCGLQSWCPFCGKKMEGGLYVFECVRVCCCPSDSWSPALSFVVAVC